MIPIIAPVLIEDEEGEEDEVVVFDPDPDEFVPDEPRFVVTLPVIAYPPAVDPEFKA